MSQAQIPHLPIPSRVGNYQLLKTIGKGQFGYVKLAIHDLTRERVRALEISVQTAARLSRFDSTKDTPHTPISTL